MSLRIHTTSSGFTALFGQAELLALVQRFQPNFNTSALQHDLHVTLITREEARQLEERSVKNPFTAATKLDDLVPIGIGETKTSSFLIVISNGATRLRTECGLPAKDLHITLSTRAGSSPEDSAHHLDTLMTPLFDLDLSADALDALSVHFHLRKLYGKSFQTCVRLCESSQSSSRAWYRLGCAAMRTHRAKVAMLAFARAFDLATDSDQTVRQTCIDKIAQCSDECDWGPTFTEKERDMDILPLPLNMRTALFLPWSSALQEGVIRVAADLPLPTLVVPSRIHVSLGRTDGGTQELQRFFRWIVPFTLAASSIPRDQLDVAALASIGIRHIVTLCKEHPLPSSYFNSTITNTFLPIVDFGAPSVEQIDIFMRLATDPATTPLLLHCAGGKGRAGTMIACYLMAYGHNKPASTPWSYAVMSSQQAITHLRNIRPGSIESIPQEKVIQEFSSQMHARGSPLPPLMEEPLAPLPTLVGSLRDVDLIVLIGLPGSGKSWFRNALLARESAWIAVSGDEDGGRSVVLDMTSRQRPGTRLIVDRCNAGVAERQELLKLAHWSSKTLAVYFDVDEDLCCQRAQQRSDHPTLPPGGRVRAAIKQFRTTLTAPTLKEGFATVATVTSFPSSFALVKQLAGPIGILKFPRTAHLISLGAETPDDLNRPLATLSLSTRTKSQTIITEKIDGANMGFSLNESLEVLTQNRSHYIDPGTHVQFKKLGGWLEVHRTELFEVLGRDEHFPERYILYGEWMNAVHSVTYSALPDLFIAFDLYDRATRTFYSRSRLESLLRPTTIPLTPLLYRGTLPSEEVLLRMIQEPSLFGAAKREGVYVKIETEEEVLERGKVVRGDFIAGNEHWSKGKISFNTVAKPD